MAAVFSDRAWADYAANWSRIKRELLDVVDFRLRQSKEENQPGADAFQIPFRNDSGETIPAYGVMRVTGVVTAASVPVITVAKPSTSFQRLYLVNGPLPVASSGEIPSWGTWADQAGFVLYDDSNTPAYGESWGPSASSWKLKKWRYGFTILGGATGGTTDIVGAIQHPVNHFWGQTQGALNKGSTGTIEIYDGNDTDTTNTMAGVKNKYANVADNMKVSVEWLGGSWYAKAAEC